ncbi:hypothetical protein NCLIV_033880 [Neospora caninum Liverpool]|uniref:Brix domain-containing protein n=1 Tax=Neospora caninum (strain Liverpool) TaxID=572307 RepID=F0VIP0_NEOCL|nr:hypothetical protein NCLIV_033880 [Neospora caninum Liverpool]CBZ53601.1 hypothetical protein NCLIV_033880 [Neospora caninum Liverpool]|eukprot:XP_003883633.1 hypothetical protein NCLIV_033880 [Neospora caninum Liverpool]
MGRRRRPGKAARRLPRGASAEEETDPRRPAASPAAPCSFVVKRGRLTPAARLLVQDLRMLMSPYCSSRLREKRSNKLKDFVAVSSLLGVTHLQAVSQTEAGVYLKVAQLPNGPTLTFQVSKFTLMKDVRKAAGLKARNDARDFRSPALLLFSGGGAGDKRTKKKAENLDDAARASLGPHDVELLVTKMMKNVFPAIDVQTVPLSECRRVALYRRQHTSASPSLTSKTCFTYQFRQYAIVRRAAGVTSGVRRLVEAASRPAVERKIFKSLGIREATQQREREREARARARLQGEEPSDGDASEDERQTRLKRRDLDICDITLNREGRGGSGFSDSEAEEEETLVEFDSRTAKATCPAAARTNQPHGGLNALLSSCAEGNLREDKKKRERDDSDEEAEGEAEEGSRDEMWKMAISLVELGPRMELQLVKIEEDVCAGKVLYHHFISKTPEELRMLKAKEAALKAERQRQRDEMERAVELQLKKKKRKDGEDEDSDGSSAATDSGDEQASGKKGKRDEKGKRSASASAGDDGGSDDGDSDSEIQANKRQRRTNGGDSEDSDGDSESDEDEGDAADDEAEEEQTGGPGKKRKNKKNKDVESPAENASVTPTVFARHSGKRGNAKQGREERKQGKARAGSAAGSAGKKKLSSADMVLQKYRQAKERSGKISGKK